jgi:hypothetical protein
MPEEPDYVAVWIALALAVVSVAIVLLDVHALDYLIGGPMVLAAACLPVLNQDDEPGPRSCDRRRNRQINWRRKSTKRSLAIFGLAITLVPSMSGALDVGTPLIAIYVFFIVCLAGYVIADAIRANLRRRRRNHARSSLHRRQPRH